MKLHRFIGDFALTSQRITISDRETVCQLKNVLRFKLHDRLVLCDGKNQEALVSITRLTDREIEVEVVERLTNTAEPKRFVSLYCALLKRENFEFVAQKATEVGIREIIPLITARTVKLAFKRARVEQILKEAAEQSGRGSIPLLHDPMNLTAAFQHARASDKKYWFEPVREGSMSTMFLKESLQKTPSMAVFIGPEGGWDESETRLAQVEEAQVTNLGALTLRGETAAILAAYLAVSL